MATDYTNQKTSCYNYSLKKNKAGAWSIKVYTFKSFVNGEDPLYETNPVTSNTYTLPLPEEEGVYIFVIHFFAEGVDPGDGPSDQVEVDDGIIEYGVIYEYCELEECFQLLISDILCNETVCDPSIDCESAGMMSAEGVKRIDIMKITTLYFELMMLIHAESMAYLNKYTLSDDRQSRWERASDLIARIKEVLIHCGICGSGAVGQSGCNCC